MASKLKDLRVYQQADAFCASVNDLLQRPAYRRYRKLAEQISDASDSITSNISEGFEQGTDAGFARYLFFAKGSLGEVLARLRESRRKGCITQEHLEHCLKTGETLGRSLGAFIIYLDESDFKDRGRYKSRQRREQARRGTKQPHGPARRTDEG